MSTDDKYNGWTNWETWNTNLWMSNEEGLYGNARAIVAEHIEAGADDAPANPASPTDDADRRRFAIRAAGKALAEWWNDYFAPDVDAAGPLADAWNATQGEVNWEEIAEGLAEE
jgi:hypothetical protein